MMKLYHPSNNNKSGLTIFPTAQGPVKPVDLRLPQDKTPFDHKTYLESKKLKTVENHTHDYAIGSSCKDELVYYDGNDFGLFSSVQEAWKNHWNLRTSPEDWWFPVACKIAKAIDKAAKPNKYNSQKVRDLFVLHEGKGNICVDLEEFDIYQVNYNNFFDTMSHEVHKRIKLPDFSTAMQSDFSCTTPAQRIASQVNLMASVQEFFSYEMRLCGCGIKSLEMLGEQADWDQLVVKLRKVEELLKPIYFDLCGVHEDWFRHVEQVFCMLAKSYDNPESQEVADFWSEVLLLSTQEYRYGPSGSRVKQVEAYDGWLIEFLIGYGRLFKDELSEILGGTGLNSVPLKVTLKYRTPVISDMATLKAGIMGFVLYGPDETFNGVPSVRPNHMWAMILSQNSPMRKPYEG